MLEWLIALIPHLKAIHILAVFVWCGGLLALGIILPRRLPTAQHDFSRVRKATHHAYTMAVTPAAVAAVISGTWLIFLRETFVPWFYAKLVFVAILVSGHAWLGYLIAEPEGGLGERTLLRRIASYLPLLILMLAIIAILAVVLAKPDLGGIQFPDWLTRPGDNQLPFEVPRR